MANSNSASNPTPPGAGPDTANLPLALYFAERKGWKVFPCGPDKRPHTAHGFHDASGDPVQIRAWWEREPAALVGIPCAPNGLFALDVDRKNGVDGDRVLFDLITTRGGGQPIPCGPMQTSPGGGYHILFALPPDGNIPNNTEKLGPGLDLRSSGYICTGTLPDGTGYRWLPEHGPEAPLTPAPAWLIALIRETQQSDYAKKHAATGQDAPADYWYNRYLPLAREGCRNDTLYRMGLQMSWSNVPPGEALDCARAFAAATHLPEAESVRTMQSAYNSPKREPARLPGAFYASGSSSPAENSSPGAPEPEFPPPEGTQEQPGVKTFADMAGMIGPIEWDWPGWLPKGMLTILAGESGAGKSGLALRVAGCFLNGWPWPDGSPFTGERGAVLWCEAEAAQAVNLDRARAWGLPLDRLYVPLPNPLDDLKLDLEGHRAMLAARAPLPEVRLIIVDSLRGVLGRGDENASETLNFIKWLAELARDTGKPILLTHHLRKRSIFDTDEVTLDRLRGSSAIPQTPRIVWALDVPDPSARGNKRFSVIKTNIGEKPQPVGMTIDEQGVKFGDAPAAPKAETVADKATDMLLSLLANEPVLQQVIEDQFKGAGISIRSMRRAKTRLGVESVKKNDGWYWSLPPKENGEVN